VLPGADARSAGFQPAVSPDFQSADAAKLRCHTVRLRLADWKSAIQQIGNLRYSRARLTHYVMKHSAGRTGSPGCSSVAIPASENLSLRACEIPLVESL